MAGSIELAILCATGNVGPRATEPLQGNYFHATFARPFGRPVPGLYLYLFNFSAQALTTQGGLTSTTPGSVAIKEFGEE